MNLGSVGEREKNSKLRIDMSPQRVREMGGCRDNVTNLFTLQLNHPHQP